MRSSRGHGDRSGDGRRPGSNRPSPAPDYEPDFYDPGDLANVDFSEDAFSFPTFAQHGMRGTSASPQPSIHSQMGSLSIRPSPAPSAPGSSRDAPAPTPPYQQGLHLTHRSTEDHKRPRRDGSSGSSSSSRPDQQRPKHSHQGEGPIYIPGGAYTQEPAPFTQGPSPQTTWAPQPSLPGISSGYGIPSTSVSTGGGSSYQPHPYVSNFEQDPANLGSFQARQMGGYAPQTQGGSSVQAYEAAARAPVIDLTDSPGPSADPPPNPVPPHRRRRRQRHREEGGEPPAQNQAPGAPVAQNLEPRVKWNSRDPTTFEVSKEVLPRGSHWSERQLFELRVIAAGYVNWVEAVDRGQDLPGKRKLEMCRAKWSSLRMYWTRAQDDLIWDFVDFYGEMSEEQRNSSWAALVETLGEQGRFLDEIQSRLNLFNRWGRAMRDENLGRGKGMPGPSARKK